MGRLHDPESQSVSAKHSPHRPISIWLPAEGSRPAENTSVLHLHVFENVFVKVFVTSVDSHSFFAAAVASCSEIMSGRREFLAVKIEVQPRFPLGFFVGSAAFAWHEQKDPP